MAATLDGTEVVYFDRGSIHAAFAKAHPEVKKMYVFLNASNSGPFAWVGDTTKCEERHEIEIERDDERWDYHGHSVGIIRWRHKPGGYIR